MEANWDSAVVVLLVLAAVAVAFGVLFRHKIKLALKAGGAEFSVEGENEARRAGTGAEPPAAASAGRPAATGDRSVSIGRDANRANIVTGDRNRVG